MDLGLKNGTELQHWRDLSLGNYHCTGYWVYTSNHSLRLDAVGSNQDLTVRMKKRIEKRKRGKGEEMMEGRKVEENEEEGIDRI